MPVFQIEFRAIRGEKEFGYLAIDDVTFVQVKININFVRDF